MGRGLSAGQPRGSNGRAGRPAASIGLAWSAVGPQHSSTWKWKGPGGRGTGRPAAALPVLPHAGRTERGPAYQAFEPAGQVLPAGRAVHPAPLVYSRVRRRFDRLGRPAGGRDYDTTSLPSRPAPGTPFPASQAGRRPHGSAPFGGVASVAALPAPRWTPLHLPRRASASRRAWSPRQKQGAAGADCRANRQTPYPQYEAIGPDRWHNVLQRVWLKITELAGQPELCSGRRFVVVVYKSTRLYIDYYYYLWRNLVPLQRVNRNLFRQSSALIWGHGVAGADRPLAGLHRQRQPRGRGAAAWWSV